MMKIFAASLLFALIGPNLSYGQTFLYREKTDLTDASARGEVTIDIASTTLSFLGTSLGFRAGFVPNTVNGLLPPGTYYLQLVLYRAFLSPIPSMTGGAPIDRSHRFDELCRSNVITINIVGP
jgi:hypothetical protein